MIWKFEAVDKLKQYVAKRQSLQSIPLEIAQVDLDMSSIRSASADSTPVAGGGNGRENAMLNHIVRKNELLRSLERAQKWVAAVDASLEVLSAEDRLILDRFYIYPEKGAADRLAGDLHIDVKTVYKRKDDALRRFTISLYGETES